MGSVYRAVHESTGEAVAVKALSPQLAGSEGFRERFRAEIESLQTLRHRSIVQLYGYGEQEGTLFYAMELVDGPSLEDEIRGGRRFDWRETAHIAIQLCRALKHAHDHGVIHRDIKPANILLGPRHVAKLADFGIARLFGATGLTISGGVLGTADYMAPEQAAGQAVTARCDQYSLGGVMYALLAGRPPFRAQDLPTMLQLQRYAVPESVRRYAPDTPADLDSAIMQLLSKEPKDRFPNTMVLARHLEAMSRALGRTAADDFELHDPSTPAPEVDADASSLAVTRDATDLTQREAQTPLADATTPAASKVRSSTRRLVHDGSDTDEAAPPATRYTTITELVEESPPFWRPMIGQAVVLLIAVGTLAGAAWWWSTPLDADSLFHRIEKHHERGATDHLARAGIEDFLDRFPDDERAVLVMEWRRKLELERTKKRINLSGESNSGQQNPAPALLYQQAMRLSREDPIRGAGALDALADLLSTDAGDHQTAAYADLARESSERLRETHRVEQRALAEFLKKKLKRAREQLATDPASASSVASGVLLLVEPNESTAAVISEARSLLAAARRAN